MLRVDAEPVLDAVAARLGVDAGSVPLVVGEAVEDLGGRDPDRPEGGERRLDLRSS
jgi:hypothetical protein